MAEENKVVVLTDDDLNIVIGGKIERENSGPREQIGDDGGSIETPFIE